MGKQSVAVLQVTSSLDKIADRLPTSHRLVLLPQISLVLGATSVFSQGRSPGADFPPQSKK